MGPAQPPVITLTTDFGLEDCYVGQLKGALLQGCPAATFVDITHGIRPWDIFGAAIAIESSYVFFPPGTVHLVVVDPGVGSERAILAAQVNEHFFIAPDNGVLSLVLNGHPGRVYRVDKFQARQRKASPTFHGRDIMAPAACALAQGVSLETLGPSVAPAGLVALPAPAQMANGTTVQTRVQHIDRFGNIRVAFRFDTVSLNRLAYIEIKGIRLNQMHQSYHEVQAGTLLALVDSSGYLEIAANQAHAAQLIDCSIGDPVTIVFHSS